MPAARVETRFPDFPTSKKTHTPGRFELCVSYPNRPFAVRRALGRVLEGLSDLDLEEEFFSSLELVLAEALNNVAEHAYPDDPAGLVELRIARRGDHLAISIVDEGRPMPCECLPKSDWSEAAEWTENPPEGGFGWLLIHRLARALRYERRNGVNRLGFEVQFSRGVRES